ncbi:MAG: phosphotransferase [Candidatus Eremiobacteraeota bacterium]|nr:phosphotransferase [Candidatus Eremiobacteraeota bacterium]
MESRVEQPWAAEIEVTAHLAATLIARQFPRLGTPSLTVLGEGWDNAAFLVNDTWVFRFPRRAIAAPLIERESRILPLIAGALPLAIPVPEFVGTPAAGYPWAFAGYRVLPGRPLTGARPGKGDEVGLARCVGGFLRALHGVDTAPLVAAGLPGDTIGRLDHARMRPKFVERLRALRDGGLVRDSAELLHFLDRVAPAGARSERLRLVHGDLYARHVLVDEDLGATGIIDWGDVHLGDPALDLAFAFITISPQARGSLFAAYGAVDARTLELARYRAIYHSAMTAHYGLCIGDAGLIAAGSKGLELGTLG